MTAVMRTLITTGTMKVFVLRSMVLLSMWIRYISSVDSGSRKDWRESEALVNGGGPDFGFEAVVVEAFLPVDFFADLAILIVLLLFTNSFCFSANALRTDSIGHAEERHATGTHVNGCRDGRMYGSTDI